MTRVDREPSDLRGRPPAHKHKEVRGIIEKQKYLMQNLFQNFHYDQELKYTGHTHAATGGPAAAPAARGEGAERGRVRSEDQRERSARAITSSGVDLLRSRASASAGGAPAGKSAAATAAPAQDTARDAADARVGARDLEPPAARATLRAAAPLKTPGGGRGAAVAAEGAVGGGAREGNGAAPHKHLQQLMVRTEDGKYQQLTPNDLHALRDSLEHRDDVLQRRKELLIRGQVTFIARPGRRRDLTCSPSRSAA